MANTLEIVIKATDKASKEISGIGQSVGGLKNIASTAFAGVSVAASAAVAAIAAVGVGMGKLAVDALPLQGIEGAFAGITGDAEAMLAALREGSQGMVTNKDLMMSYNQAAQLVGKQFADQLPSAMQYLSKVSAATGQDMGFMLDSLVKGVGRMSPMILDNLGIQVSLADATDRAAAMFGVEAEELTKAQLQAGMMDVVLDKLKENTASMPDVAGTAAQGWAAFQVTLQNTKDSIGLALVPALQSIMEPLSGLTDKMLPVLVDWFEAKVIPAVEKMAGAFGIFFEGLSNGRGFVASFEDALWKMLPPDMAAQITGIIDKIGEFGAKIQEFVSQHAEAFKAALIAIGAVIAGAAVAGAIMSIAGAIAALANPITLIVVAIGLLGAAWSENWGGIQEKTQAAIGWIAPKIQEFLTKISAWWAENGEQITATVVKMWGDIQQWFTTALGNITQWVQTALVNIKSWWQDHGDAVIDLVGLLWQDIQNKFTTALNIVKGVVNMALAIIRGDWYDVGVQLRNIVDTMWDGIKNAFNIAKEALLRIIRELVNNMKWNFTDIDWGAVGRGVIDGIVGGVRAAAGGLAQAAADAARAALDAAKGFLGIRSPSKVTANLIGKPFAEGIFKGIEDATRVLERTKMPDIMASITAAPMQMQPVAQPSPVVSNSPQYHLHITTSAPTENIIADFAVLQALAG